MASSPRAAAVRGEQPPGYVLPRGFRLGAIRDAVAIEVFRGEVVDLVLVRFSDTETARLRRAEVNAALNLATSEVVALSDDVRQPGPVWPQTAWGRVERLAAALGVLLALLNYWSLFFAAPHVSVQTEATQNLVAGRVAGFGLRVSNRGDSKVTVDLSSAQAFKIEPFGVTLEPREEKTVLVSGLSPATATADVGVKGLAKSGLLRGAVEVSAQTRLVVWPREKVDEITDVRVYQHGRAAAFTLPLRVGDATKDGMRCEATVARVKRVVISGAQPARQIDSPQVNEEDGNEFAYLSWSLPSMEAFTERSIQVILESSTPKGEDEWRSVPLSVSCSRRSS